MRDTHLPDSFIYSFQDLVKHIAPDFPLLVLLFLITAGNGFSQRPKFVQDSTLNNLIHPAGYETSPNGRLGAVSQSGHGKSSMILIPGIGFGGDVFDELIAAYKDRFTVYAVTPAGFGNTAAPAMPAAGTSYAEMTWTNGIVTGVLDLIEKENLDRPIVVGHFATGTQVALNLALAHPEKIGKVIILSGQPYRYYPSRTDASQFDWSKESKLTQERRSQLADQYWAPKWFKTVTKETWISNNWQANEYSADSSFGMKWVDESAAVPLQVNIRYLLEFFTYDVTSRYQDIKIPVLILIPSFDDAFLTGREEYLKYFQQEAWNSARNKNPLLQFKVVPDSRIFMWHDNPSGTFNAIDNFLAP